MVPVFLLTLRQGRRMWGLVPVVLGGLLALLAGRSLSILAVGADEQSDLPLVRETANLVAVVGSLWLLLSCLDRDQRSGFALAAYQSRSSQASWLLGRALGALVVGGLMGSVLLGLGLWLAAEEQKLLWLYVTLIWYVGHVTCWGVLLARLAPSPGLAMLPCLGLVALGHLPWGGPGFLAGRLGQSIGNLLPHLVEGPEYLLGSLGSGAALVLLALAVPVSWRSPA